MAVGQDAADLAGRMTLLAPLGRMVHLCGTHVAGDLANRLSSAGIETVSHVIYDQIAQPLSAPALTLLSGSAPLLVPLFSTRSAQLFQDQTRNSRAPLWVVAFSPAVSGAVTRPVARHRVAVRPDGAAMLDAMAEMISPWRVT